MKYSIMLSVILLAISACANVKLDEGNRLAMQRAMVSQNVTISREMTVQSTSQSIGEALGGALGAVIKESGKSDTLIIGEVMARNGIDPGKILVAEFSKALKRSGKSPDVDSNTIPSAEFRFDIMMHGLQKTQGFSNKLFATYVVKAVLVSADGKVLWQKNDYVTALHERNTTGAEPSAYISDPELLRQAFSKAAEIVCQSLVDGL